MCERVGGGFGGKQEMLVEDIVALAVLRTGRPREAGADPAGTVHRDDLASRHAGQRKARARADGTLTAMALDVLSDTGAYANHAGGVLHHGCDESLAVYRCPNKRVDAPGGPHHHGAGRRVPRLRAEPDGVRRGKRHGRVGARPGHGPVHPAPPECLPARRHDARRGCGIRQLRLAQCIDSVEKALADDTSEGPPGWQVGRAWRSP